MLKRKECGEGESNGEDGAVQNYLFCIMIGYVITTRPAAPSLGAVRPTCSRLPRLYPPDPRVWPRDELPTRETKRLGWAKARISSEPGRSRHVRGLRVGTDRCYSCPFFSDVPAAEGGPAWPELSPPRSALIPNRLPLKPIRG